MKGLLEQAFKDAGLIAEVNGRPAGVFDRRRGNVGRSYGFSAEIREISKKAIEALVKGDREGVDLYLHEMGKKFSELKTLDLPADIAWQMQSEAGQEYVEAYFTAVLYDKIIEQTEYPKKIHLPEYFQVTEPAWLHGIADAVTEMSRVLGKYLLNRKLSREDRIQVRVRYLDLGEAILDAISLFENATPNVVNNTRRKGYGNTYRGVLGRIRGALDRHIERLIAMYDQEAT